ncbi:flagellar biosynthesis protein FlhB [Azospirillum sp. TSO22-1]|uniref:flagellar biosynthesis protein FlhB n=1 Tax=Azospirillum sp. TSO22-1 TaxID=716789 RepID=UPI000D60F0DD|nr:flagellar biosynthesis protein FlhB [Azospirillum sp. TSO22-1]PWC42583.1 flagellar biosynthesis protein [Azospirillum sp. TSO22-1]
MADGQDDEQKTEEPTEKRLREAEEKGDVPRARDVGLLAAMAAAWLIVAAAAPGAASRLAATLLPLIENPDDIRIDGSPYDVLHSLSWLLAGVGLALLPVLGILVLAAAVSAFGQGQLVVAQERIRPKLSNLSLFGGWKRIFSTSALAEFLKSLAKLAAIGFAAWFAVAPYITWTEGVVNLDVAALPELLRDLTLRLLLAVLLATVLMAAIDVLWNRYQWRKRLRMTFQELKDEFKQTEGDPAVKARLREMRRERSRRRMMSSVPRATVVVTNPTHFAVALEYDRARMPAPVCLAKGADLMALRIRSIAEENGVPIIENPPLARALHGSAEIDEPIPLQHYQAVAEVITYVLRLKGGPAARRGAPGRGP